MPNLETEILDFVAEFTGAKREKLTPDSTLYGDLGVDGADGWELIEEFGRRFQVDVATFRGERHFGPEGFPVYAPFAWLFHLVSWPFRKKQTPEEKAGLLPIRIADLIAAAERRRWPLNFPVPPS